MQYTHIWSHVKALRGFAQKIPEIGSGRSLLGALSVLVRHIDLILLGLVVPNRSRSHCYMIEEKDPAAVELGRRGGKKGGPARAAKMTPEERSESARKAAKARWDKKRQGEEESLG